MPTRRSFLKTSALTTLGGGLAYTTGDSALLAETAATPNEQSVVGFIGTGIRYHSSLAHGATRFGPCAAICDVDAMQLRRAHDRMLELHSKQKRPLGMDLVEDYRRVLDRKDINAVIIGTTDHWHTKIAIEAMQAGKDVYCEKPLTLTIREGQQILTVMKQTGRIVQVGTQQRTEFGKRFAKAAAIVRDGRVGEVKRVTVAIGGSRVCDALPIVPVSKELNWERWQGQAPLAEYRVGELVDKEGWGAGFPFSRTHRYFRWFYEYSGGKLTDWGAHHVDIALWGLNKLNGNIGKVTIDPLEVKHPVKFVEGYPTENDRFNAASSFKVSVKFEDGIEMMIRDNAVEDLGFENGIMFEGSKSRFLVNRGKMVGKPIEELKDKPLPADALEKLYGGKVPAGHMNDFFECIKTRQQPTSDVQSHHRMLSICHAVNIALRLGRKLTFDTKLEKFVNDAQADTFIEREQRKGYEINV